MNDRKTSNNVINLRTFISLKIFAMYENVFYNWALESPRNFIKTYLFTFLSYVENF